MLRPSIVYSKRNGQADQSLPVTSSYRPQTGMSVKMRKSLESMLSKLEAMQAQAEDRCDSENEATAERYDNVCGCLSAAIEAIGDAIDCFNS